MSQLLRRLRPENGRSPGGGTCSELRSRHCAPAWATERYSVSKKKKKKKKMELRGRASAENRRKLKQNKAHECSQRKGRDPSWDVVR